MGKVLYGYVSNVESPVDYVWSAEDGACEECMALDGKVFNSADEVPDRPHPNCKCHVEVREKPQDDPISQHRSAVRERKEQELELAKMLGDARSLQEQIDAVIYTANEQNSLLLNSDTEELPTVVLPKFETLKHEVATSIRAAEAAKTKALAFEKKVENAQIKEISKLKFEFRRIRESVDDLGKEVLDRGILVGGIAMQESGALWRLSYSKFKDGQDYVEKNGKVYESVEELEDTKIKNLVKTKIQKQFRADDSRGIVFHSDSKLSEKISSSFALKKMIKNNKIKLLQRGTIPDTSLSFGILNADLFNAIHRADIVDIFVDENGDFNAKVIDTYDFNPKSRNPLVWAAGHYQNEGKIENYYVVVQIKVPREKWEKY